MLRAGFSEPHGIPEKHKHGIDSLHRPSGATQTARCIAGSRDLGGGRGRAMDNGSAGAYIGGTARGICRREACRLLCQRHRCADDHACAHGMWARATRCSCRRSPLRHPRKWWRWSGRPVFVDVLEDTYNMDPASLEAAIAMVKREGKLQAAGRDAGRSVRPAGGLRGARTHHQARETSDAVRHGAGLSARLWRSRARALSAMRPRRVSFPRNRSAATATAAPVSQMTTD